MIFEEGQIVWFVYQDKITHTAGVLCGKVLSYTNIENSDKIIYKIESISAISNVISIGHYSKVFDIEEQFVFPSESKANSYKSKLGKTKTSNTHTLTIEYTKTELKNLVETLLLCRQLLIDHVVEDETEFGYLDDIDRLLNKIKELK